MQEGKRQQELAADMSQRASWERTPFSFEDYLAQRQDVPLNSFLFWMRRWGADPRIMGYIRAVWKKISRRADLLESILWCANDENLKGKQRVGFLVSEIKARAA